MNNQANNFGQTVIDIRGLNKRVAINEKVVTEDEDDGLMVTTCDVSDF